MGQAENKKKKNIYFAEITTADHKLSKLFI